MTYEERNRRSYAVDLSPERQPITVPLCVTVGCVLLGTGSVPVTILNATYFPVPGAWGDPTSAYWTWMQSIPVLCVISILASWKLWFRSRDWDEPFHALRRTLWCCVASLPLVGVVGSIGWLMTRSEG